MYQTSFFASRTARILALVLLLGAALAIRLYDLTDLPLDKHIADFRQRGSVASFIAVRTAQSFHSVHAGDDGFVTSLGKISESEFWINAGFFAMQPEIFKYIEGDQMSLESVPLQKLAQEKQLVAFKHTKFWQPMDTLRDKINLDNLWKSGNAPWKVW